MKRPGYNHTVLSTIFLFLCLGAALAPAAFAGEAQAFNGQYDWADGGKGPLNAEFKPDGKDTEGKDKWKVTFRFEFSGKNNTWKGTADGNFEDGAEITGTSKWNGRNWIFKATLTDGILTGQHTELRKDGSKYETGTFELAR